MIIAVPAAASRPGDDGFRPEQEKRQTNYQRSQHHALRHHDVLSTQKL